MTSVKYSHSECEIHSKRWVKFVFDEWNLPHWGKIICKFCVAKLLIWILGDEEKEYRKYRRVPSGCNVVSISTKYVGNNINKMEYKLMWNLICVGACIARPCVKYKIIMNWLRHELPSAWIENLVFMVVNSNQSCVALLGNFHMERTCNS